MRTLVAVLIAVGLVSLYLFAYLKNKHTPVPPGCENLSPDCAGCGIANCEIRAKKEKEEYANR